MSEILCSVLHAENPLTITTSFYRSNVKQSTGCVELSVVAMSVAMHVTYTPSTHLL